MRVGIDVRAMTAAPYSGIARQVQALYDTLCQRPDTEALAFTTAPLNHPHRGWAHCPGYASPATGLHRPTERWRFERGFLPRAIDDLALDVYVATVNMGLPIGLNDLQRRRTKWVLQMHDVFQLTLRNRHDTSWREFFYRWFDKLSIRHAARLADAIWVPSDYTAQTVTDALPDTAGRIRVLPNAVPFGPWQGAQQGVELPRRYWLLVGTREPRKNVAWFVAAWQRARQQWPNDVPDLVLVGHPGDLPETPAGVRFVHDLDDDQLRACYRGAERLWHPSYAEGFGLPVVEAAACGTPVATARGSSLDEVTPPAAPRFDPQDTAAVVRLMHQMTTQGRGPGESAHELQQWARRYDLPVYGQRVDALLRELR